MDEDNTTPDPVEEVWRVYLVDGTNEKELRQRRVFRMLPGHPRCKNCYAPFSGAGSMIVRALYGKLPSNLNPKLCNGCETFARHYPGGAEVELTLLFADVRGSTQLAEKMGPKEFGQLIDRFYKTATHVMVKTDALIDKIIGDQAAGIYTPGIAGKVHAQKALMAAKEIMQKTGHRDENGPWIPLGAGVHTGISFVGSVGSTDGPMDITVLGDVANTAARLSSAAQVGEILISEESMEHLPLDQSMMERRELELKGKSNPVPVFVLKSHYMDGDQSKNLEIT